MAKITRPSGPRQAVRPKSIPIPAHRRSWPRRRPHHERIAELIHKLERLLGG